MENKLLEDKLYRHYITKVHLSVPVATSDGEWDYSIIAEHEAAHAVACLALGYPCAAIVNKERSEEEVRTIIRQAIQKYRMEAVDNHYVTIVDDVDADDEEERTKLCYGEVFECCTEPNLYYEIPSAGTTFTDALREKGTLDEGIIVYLAGPIYETMAKVGKPTERKIRAQGDQMGIERILEDLNSPNPKEVLRACKQKARKIVKEHRDRIAEIALDLVNDIGVKHAYSIE